MTRSKKIEVAKIRRLKALAMQYLMREDEQRIQRDLEETTAYVRQQVSRLEFAGRTWEMG